MWIIGVTVLVLIFLSTSQAANFPLPFYRELTSQNPPIKGNDVTILQNFVSRSKFVSTIELTGLYDTQTAKAVAQFQSGNGIKQDDLGTFGPTTASELLRLHSADLYRDNNIMLPGYKYKVFIPVFRNRSLETMATLYDSQLNVRHVFKARLHGQNAPNGDPLNEFTSDGSTPTGLVTFDLNSPEPDPVDYGPYPVNRAVQGLQGNAKFLIPNIRNGILLHTGEWDNWNPSLPMPNSHGCIHAHPDDIYIIWQILEKQLGVEVRENPLGKLPYPFVPQGLLSIELH